ncbi:hypothetical protein QMA40_30095 (plasmid) [Bacillus thuringiensis]|uniref:hypothetical protein n=1 Tax=Bacillus thuringiensis TaxID=1428 RepID=UPI003977A9D1
MWKLEKSLTPDKEISSRRTVGVMTAERVVVPEICMEQNALGSKGAFFSLVMNIYLNEVVGLN